MLMSDVKRALKLLPHGLDFRKTMLFALGYMAFGVFLACTAKDASDLSLVFFCCMFPVILVATTIQQLELPYIVRTSPHKARMVTGVPVVFHIVLSLVMWGVMLLVMTLLGPRCGLTPEAAYFYAGWYTTAIFLLSVCCAVSLKISGGIIWVFYLIMFMVVVVFIIIMPRNLESVTVSGIPVSTVSSINAGGLTALVVLGILITAPIYYFILRILNFRMVNNMTMDRIKG